MTATMGRGPVTTAIERALLAQAGLELDGYDTNDAGAQVEIWNVSARVQMVIDAAGAHFIVGGEDRLGTRSKSVADALTVLRFFRTHQPEVYGSNRQ